MKNSIQKIAVVLTAMLIVAFATPVGLLASNLDELYDYTTLPNQTPTQVAPAPSQGGTAGSNNSAVGDFINGYQPITNEQMNRASTLASPVVNIIAQMAGVVIVVTFGLLGLITALDLLYIAAPFSRSVLNPLGAQQAPQAGGMPMGGMGMGGMGMRGMGMGGMGMMGGGAQAPQAQAGLPWYKRQWVSDEAVYCVNTFAAPQAPAQPAGGMPMGGMGMGMGGMGMMGGMGGMGAQPQAQPLPTKLVILEYFKRRTLFLIIFAAAAVVLTASALSGFGVNVGKLIIAVIDKLSTSASNVQIQ